MALQDTATLHPMKTTAWSWPISWSHAGNPTVDLDGDATWWHLTVADATSTTTLVTPCGLYTRWRPILRSDTAAEMPTLADNDDLQTRLQR